MDAKLTMDNIISKTNAKFGLLSAFITSMLLPVCAASSSPVLALPASQTSVTSSAVQDAPFIERRADPWVIKDDDGSYYFIASVPEFDRIELRHAANIQGLSQAIPKIIWRKHTSGPMSIDIWAPELHKIDGRWYIYYAASDKDRRFHNRMFVLGLEGDNPMKGDWQELGRLKTARDGFSLDATHFSVGGQGYFIWAQQDDAKSYNTGLVIAKMLSPTAASPQEAIISEPLLDWERQGFKVNEGAAVLVKNGKVFVTYSASATDDRYAMGLLWAEQDADLLDPKNWHKVSEPVFSTEPTLNRFGPGHNSFVLAEDGQTELMFYHARNYLELQGTPLTDGNRHTYYRAISWTENGFPVFHNELADNVVDIK
ncbi:MULTISPECIES: glycoside hydrolase family 43 protein [Shewanella]|jgi:GH43 family beta-xylosidase|uniref:glycoside hydrolase family 43 protein n=1 Tax=Shewanella TaxID=22 RepID=UPI00005FDECB|nr:MULTISPECIES: family 43 glycosylhydrolase [Shewanella]ABM24792.1 Alpha-N-arabinofuranosidase [Shewanella sp. W3-18-1]SUI55407.1 Alpha-N-arabinofuranosidase 2 precursor [Shewanella putrefaciens]